MTELNISDEQYERAAKAIQQRIDLVPGESASWIALAQAAAPYLQARWSEEISYAEMQKAYMRYFARVDKGIDSAVAMGTTIADFLTGRNAEMAKLCQPKERYEVEKTYLSWQVKYEGYIVASFYGTTGETDACAYAERKNKENQQ